jgi:hypothetical protein
MLATNRRDRLFTGEFRPPVDVHWIRLVAFDVGGIFAAVEHVVGRIVNQERIK